MISNKSLVHFCSKLLQTLFEHCNAYASQQRNKCVISAQDIQRHVLGRLRSLLFDNEADAESTGEVLEYFMRRLSSVQTAERDSAVKVQFNFVFHYTMTASSVSVTKSCTVVGYPSGMTRSVTQENSVLFQYNEFLFGLDGWIWASFFFCVCLWSSSPSRSLNTQKWGQSPAILTSRLVNNPYLYNCHFPFNEVP